MFSIRCLIFGLILVCRHKTHANALGNQVSEEEELETDPTLSTGYFEGDIAGFDPAEPIGRNAIVSHQKKWPDGIVPYEISNQFGNYHKRLIEKAMRAVELQTCIKFKSRTTEDDYMYFIKDRGCYSTVGRHGGRQDVSLDRDCLHHGIVIHELLHNLGFWHEQSRADRDDHIVIKWQNIQTGMEKNFQKYSWEAIQDLVGLYDIKSIMHYGPKAFTRNNWLNTIEPKNRQDYKHMGQRKNLSPLDVEKINKLYSCPGYQFKRSKSTTN